MNRKPSLEIYYYNKFKEKKNTSFAFSYPQLSSPGGCSIEIQTSPFG